MEGGMERERILSLTNALLIKCQRSFNNCKSTGCYQQQSFLVIVSHNEQFFLSADWICFLGYY